MLMSLPTASSADHSEPLLISCWRAVATATTETNWPSSGWRRRQQQVAIGR